MTVVIISVIIKTYIKTSIISSQAYRYKHTKDGYQQKMHGLNMLHMYAKSGVFFLSTSIVILVELFGTRATSEQNLSSTSIVILY